MSSSLPAPGVSVVMSVYNDVRRVEQSVRSVLLQTFPHWELIVIDDGSTDGSSELLDRLVDLDRRIRVVHQENTGLTRALIRGCSLARAPYIARQDADDLSLPERLACQAAVLDDDPAIGFVSCWTQYVGPEDEPLEVIRRPADAVQATRQLLDERQGPPAHGSVMFRKTPYDRVGGYRDEFHFGQDADLWLRMAEQSRFACVQETLYVFRVHLNSISGSRRLLQSEFGRLGQACRAARREGRSEQPYLEEARRLSDQIRTTDAGHVADRRDQTQMAYLIGSQLARRGDRRAAKYLRQVLRHTPWHWRAWVRLGQCYATRRKHAETLDDA